MGNFDLIVTSHSGFCFAYKQKNAKLVVFSALFVEQVVAIWSGVTEDTYTETLTAPPETGPDASFLMSQQKQRAFVKYEFS